MKHKLIAALLALFLLIQLPAVVFANELSVQMVENEKSEVLTSYRTGNKIFSFIHFDGQVPDGSKLTLSVSEDKRQTGESLQSVWTQSPAEITLLVDTTVPMEQHKDNLLLFAKNLMSKGPKDLTVSVVTVKNAKEVASGLRDWESLERVLNELKFEGWVSDLCGSVVTVLDRIGQEDHDNGAMLNLVVFSKSKGYYNDDGAKNVAERNLAANGASRAIEKHPETIVHSVCVENMNTMEQQALAKGGGCQLKAGDSVFAANAAVEIADYINNAWTAKFTGYEIEQLPLDNLSIRYQTVENGSFMMHNLPVGVVADLKPAAQIPAEQPDTAVESTTPAEEAPAENPSEVPAESEGADPAGETTEPEETTVPEGSEGENPDNDPSEGAPDGENTGEADPNAGEPGGKGKGSLFLWIGIALGAVIILGIVIAIVLSTKHRKSAAVVMRAVVEFGAVQNLRERYFLKKSLIIGSGRGCDIVIPGASVSPKNTRIYLDKNIVYVEDLNSQRGTLIGGMRIYSPNRLRSGDVITVGNTSIRFLF